MPDGGRPEGAAGRQVEIFTTALGLQGADRESYLDAACGGDAPLRAAIDKLLAAHGSAGRFLETPAVKLGGSELTPASAPDFSGRRVGQYRLISRIGRGGMGSVYLAERADLAYEKQVAVKLVHPETGSAEILRRFETERQVLAGLDHPHIAHLIDGGVTEDDVPYLVMEHVDGVAIDAYCRERNLSIEGRLRLFRSVCEAVHYAHQRLVVHRDLKPSNILVTGDGVVKLLDFGIAKVLSGANGDVTRTEMRVMTPRYASPEQIRGEPITTASDVYALGILLYELLTGAHPFADADTPPRAIERAICESEPEPPSTRARRTSGTETTPVRQPSMADRSRRLRGDLDTIVLMALRKEPGRRYASAQQLGEDVRRHLAGEPVLARPETLRYVLGKFVRRHAVSVGAVITLATALVVAAIVSTTLYVRAGTAQRESERQRRSAEEIATFLSDMLGSIHPAAAQGRDVTLLREILDRAAVRIDTELPSSAQAAASLHLTTGATYGAIADYEEAERHLTRAVELAREVAATERDARSRKLLFDALVALGRFQVDASRFAEAKSLLLEARALLGHGSSDRLRLTQVTTSLGHALTAQLEIAAADSCFRTALEIRRELLAQAPDDTVAIAGASAALMNLASFLNYYGDRPDPERRAEAEPLAREAVTLARRSGDRNIIARALQDHADLLKRMERYDEAEPLFLESLAITRSLWGDDHPNAAGTLDNLAALYEFRGDYEKAEPRYREALRVQLATLGTSNRAVGTTYNNLGGLLRKMGRYADADTCMQRAIEIYRRTMGDEHAWVGIALANRAATLAMGGEPVRAEPVAREAIHVMRVSMPPSTWRIAEVETILGGCLTDQRRYAEAETLLVGAVDHLETLLEPGNTRILRARDALATLYEKTGRISLAEEIRATLVEPIPPR